LNVSLYAEDTPVESKDHAMTGRASWKVTITEPMPGDPQRGWAMDTITSDPGDPRAGYVVFYEPKGLRALFWLH
jgi:hypothetical protein